MAPALRHPALACALLASCARTPASPDAPGTAWSLGPAMPRLAFASGVTALGTRLIVLGGYAAGPALTARVDGFDPATARWAALPDAPVAWRDPNVAVVGTTLFLAGGIDGLGAAHREAFALDPLGQGWAPVTSMDPADARGAAAVVTAPGRIYLLGGASAAGALASCVEYDTVGDQWTRLPDLPAPRAHAAAMRLVDGTLIVAGGLASLDGSAPRDEVWALPPPGSPGRAWQPRAPIHAATGPDTRGGCASGVVLGRLICAGGEAGTVAQRAVDGYEPYLDRWTPLADPVPVGRAGTQGAAVGGRLYLPGGAASVAVEPSDTLYVFDPLATAL